MKKPNCCLTLLLFLCTNINAQDAFLDTFIRKDGIHCVPEFTARGNRTLFASSKNKVNENMLQQCTQRVKGYLNISKKEKEPLSNFHAVRYLQAKDSAGYFGFLESMPPSYQLFFKALYLVEENHFKTAWPLFDTLFNTATSDSLLFKEVSFWRTATQELLSDEQQYNLVRDAYTRLQNPAKERYNDLLTTLNQITSPAYQFHKYLVQYNYNYHIRNYAKAKESYDSVLRYTSHTKMKSSLIENRSSVLEMLDAKDTYVNIIKRKLYYYELADLYDHLMNWSKNNSTSKWLVEDAGFKLQPKFSKNADSVFTRLLKDTADVETNNKFEVLSFTKTVIDREGKKLVTVKLAFSNEDTYKFYLPQLASFKNKPVGGSLFFTSSGRADGYEYLLTRHFIAALYQQDEPVTKYVLALYSIEDKDGHLYAVDTLF